MATGLLLAALLVTGVLLFFWYRPDSSTFFGLEVTGETGIEHDLRRVHGATSWLFLGAVGVVLVTTAWSEVRRAARQLAWALVAVGLGVLALAAAFSGLLLPWEQLAVAAETVPQDLRGVRAAFDDDVRFVVIGGTEISPTTYRTWALVHVAAVPLALGAVGAVLARRAWSDEGVTEP